MSGNRDFWILSNGKEIPVSSSAHFNTDGSVFQDKPVVESYLYADNSPSVKISKLIPFKNDMVFSDMDVNKLTIDITESISGKKYTLSAIGDGTYENSTGICAVFSGK